MTCTTRFAGWRPSAAETIKGLVTVELRRVVAEAKRRDGNTSAAGE